MSDPRQVAPPRARGAGRRRTSRRSTRCGCASSRRSRCSAGCSGPWALLGFAVLAIVGYARARRAGLLRSRCKLGDTRLVLAYLVVLAVAAGVGIYLSLT